MVNLVSIKDSNGLMQVKKWCDFELEAMIKHYTNEVKRLSTEKGIKVSL